MGSVLFQNASIIDGQSTEIQEGYDVLVENNKIKEIIVASRQVLSEEE